MLGLPGAGGDDMEDDVVINGGPATATTPTEISPAPRPGSARPGGRPAARRRAEHRCRPAQARAGRPGVPPAHRSAGGAAAGRRRGDHAAA
ncbi:hypothetical protein V2I01_33980 [Micromonospora sp. BRA006-A]|nr:hypothetical protein [Micromonospora sp. BRA006-A]